MFDKEIDDEIIIEEAMVIHKNEDLFNFKSMIHYNLKCTNSLLKNLKKK